MCKEINLTNIVPAIIIGNTKGIIHLIYQTRISKWFGEPDLVVDNFAIDMNVKFVVEFANLAWNAIFTICLWY